MRPNNRQRPRGGGRNGGGGGGGGGQHYQKQHTHNPNRQPNRNQLFDSSGPDVRVRGNAHQVFDKYQALAREAAASGDRILSEAYWQYAEHYFRMIQTMGGITPRNNQGWGDEGGEGNVPQQGQNGSQQGQNGQPQNNGDGGPPSNSSNTNGNYNNSNNGGGDHPQQGEQQHRPERNEQGDRPERSDQNDRPDRNQRSDQNDRPDRNQRADQNDRPERQQGDRPERYQRSDRNGRPPEPVAPPVEAEPGLGDVAFLKGGRSTPVEPDPAVVEQPDIPEFTPPTPRGRRSSSSS